MTQENIEILGRSIPVVTPKSVYDAPSSEYIQNYHSLIENKYRWLFFERSVQDVLDEIRSMTWTYWAVWDIHNVRRSIYLLNVAAQFEARLIDTMVCDRYEDYEGKPRFYIQPHEIATYSRDECIALIEQQIQVATGFTTSDEKAAEIAAKYYDKGGFENSSIPADYIAKAVGKVVGLAESGDTLPPAWQLGSIAISDLCEDLIKNKRLRDCIAIINEARKFGKSASGS